MVTSSDNHSGPENEASLRVGATGADLGRPKTARRVAFVGPAHPYRGGIAHFIEHLYTGLEARGHETYLVTFTRQYPRLLFPGKTQMVEAGRAAEVDAERLLDSINPLSWQRTARSIAKWKPDAVVFKYWMPYFAPAFGRIARSVRKRGAKVIVVVDNALPHERRPGDVLLGRYFLRTADGLIVMSEQVRRDLEQSIGTSASVSFVAHPVYDNFGPAPPRHEARARLELRPDDKVMLFFGFIRKYKGLDVLLDALPRIISEVPNAVLVVAGEFYGDRKSYLTKIRELGIQDHVRLHTDYIPDQEVGRYFSAADVVVQPYISATQSGVAQIAFNYDRPVIVTDVGGLAEIVGGNAGLVVPPSDPIALADATVKYFKEDLGAGMTAAVATEKEKYSWDRIYEAIEALIE